MLVLDTEMRRALYLFYMSEGKSNLCFLCYEHESGFLTKIYFQNRQEAVQLCTGTSSFLFELGKYCEVTGY